MTRIVDTTFIPRASSLYYALLYADPQLKNAINTLMAFYREIKNIADKQLEAQVASLKLSWWSTEIDRTYRHSPQHPITQNLLPFIQQFQLPEECFQQFLEGIKLECNFKGFEKEEDFLHFLQLRSGIDQLFSQILSYPAPHPETFVTYWSLSLQIIDLIRFFGKDIRQGHLLFPQDAFKDVPQPSVLLDAHFPTEVLASIFSKQAQEAKAYYALALKNLNENVRYTQCSLLMLGNIQLSLLGEMIQDNFPVIHQKISLTPLRKFWIAWRTQAAEKKRFKRIR